FGTLLSSQGTDASFVLTSAHRLKLSSGLRSSFFVSDSIRSLRTRFLGAFQVSAFAFPFPAVPTVPDHFRALLLESRNQLDLNGGRWGPVPFGAPLR
ncbi:hypothetical protein ABZX75_15080, partial [Streptomyces sp. NPDC003038]|uniref:hypothetical protein n=1 Tax=Streptomyces sp. NPDC003038 TaxID=3154546 RepID=UPI0033A19BF5